MVWFWVFLICNEASRSHKKYLLLSYCSSKMKSSHKNCIILISSQPLKNFGEKVLVQIIG